MEKVEFDKAIERLIGYRQGLADGLRGERRAVYMLKNQDSFEIIDQIATIIDPEKPQRP